MGCTLSTTHTKLHKRNAADAVALGTAMDECMATGLQATGSPARMRSLAFSFRYSNPKPSAFMIASRSRSAMRSLLL